MVQNSPSGERQPGSRQVDVPSPSTMPLAGRTKLEKRLDAYCVNRGDAQAARGFLGLPTHESQPLDDAMFYAPEDNPFAWPTSPRYGAARLCAVCALISASIVAGAAIAFFWFTRPAGAMTPAMLPREPMQQDVVFGAVAFAIVMLAVAALYLFGRKQGAGDPHA